MNFLPHDKLSQNLLDGITDYVNFGIEPEGFLREVICGNLYDALRIASIKELDMIPSLVKVIESHVPTYGYGSEARMLRYLETHPSKKILA